VRVVREEARLSERHACGLIGMHRGSWRYQRRERNEGALRTRLRELAAERLRFGYRRLYIFLQREKTEDGTLRWQVNHKRVYRRKPRSCRTKLTIGVKYVFKFQATSNSSGGSHFSFKGGCQAPPNQPINNCNPC